LASGIVCEKPDIVSTCIFHRWKRREFVVKCG
jgi:hypothetical protein